MSQAEIVAPPTLADRLREFLFPGGEQAARSIRAIRITQDGEMRMSPEARWIPFTANELFDTNRSSFRWEARVHPGRINSATVIDAYEGGHGFLSVKLGGILPVKRITGPDVDKAELQRYLAYLIVCPPMLLNHPTLQCTTIEPRSLRIQEQADPTGAIVDFELSEDGTPLICRAQRPRLEGKNSVLRPWSGTAHEFREYEGLRVATKLEVAWTLPEGVFTYFRSEIASFSVVR